MTEDKKHRLNIGSVLFFFIILIIVIYLIKGLFFNIKTEVLTAENLENSVATQGVVIRDEQSILIPDGANIEYFVEDGEKVAYNKRLVEVLNAENHQGDISIQIAELQSRIDQMKNNESDPSIFANDLKKLEDNIFRKTTEIKSYIKNGQYELIETAKTELSRYLFKKTLIDSEGTFFAANLETLEKQKADLEKLYKENYKVLYASASGIVSYDIDSLEEILTPDKIKSMKPSDLEVFINMENQVKPGMKIIKDYFWYVSTVVDVAFVENLKVGKNISIRFSDISQEKIPATIYHISEEENGKIALTLRLEHFVNNYYNRRIEKVELIKGEFRGYKVSNEAIVDKNGVQGIYVSRNQIAKFVPIEVLINMGEYSIVKDLNDRTEEMEDYAKLKQYDEVIITTKLIKENRPIN